MKAEAVRRSSHAGSGPHGEAGAAQRAPGNVTQRRDRRDSRWDEHRRARREQLVQATLTAVGRHGAGVGMDEIAAEAGTSKTVIYRHFGDRTGLYTAVVEWVHDYILTNLEVPLRGAKTEPARLVVELTDTYLGLVQRDPEIYRFVVSRPMADVPVADPVGSFTARLGDRVAEAMAEHLAEPAELGVVASA